MRSAPTPTQTELEALKRQLARVRVAEVRNRLLRALVLWELGYPRESVSHFRLTAESALERLLDSADPKPGAALAEQRQALERGQCGKVIEWLYRSAEEIPARIALHLHTLLGWGSYASHHQREGHRIEAGDLGILTAIAIDLEDWVSRHTVAGSPSILREHAGGDELERAIADAAQGGLPEPGARALVAAAGGTASIGDGRLSLAGLAIELFWRRPGPRAPLVGPQRGLQPFDPEDAGGFHGRRRASEALVAGLGGDSPLLLSGEAGAGKTSLLRASLVPDALDRGTKVLFVGEPSADGLTAAVRVIGAWPARKGLLLIVDQLERAFFNDVPADVRRLAVQLALSAGRWPGIDAIFALREDYLGRFWREAARADEERARALRQQQTLVVLDPMRAGEARAAVEGMLQAARLGIDDELLDECLLPELCGEDGVVPVHLQIVCKALIDEAGARGSRQIGQQLYRSLGGVCEILSGHLQRAISSSQYRGQRDLTRALLKSLAGSEGRAWLDHGDVWLALRRAGHRVDELELVELLQKLQQDRLVVSRTGAAGPVVTYSLSHDVLVPEVAGWRNRGEAERERAQELLDHALKQWGGQRSSEPLAGRSLQLVERCWEQLIVRDREAADALLRSARGRRRTKRLIAWALVSLAAIGLGFGGLQFRAALRQQTRARAAARIGVLLSARLALQRDPSLAVAWLRHLSPGANGLAVRSLLDEARHRGVARVLAGHSALVTSVAFSPDGKTLLSASRDRTLRLWSRAEARALGGPLRGHTHYVTRAIFSPDGELIATSSWDRTVRLWRARSRALVGQPLRGHTGWVYDVAFSPDGELLASVDTDGVLRLWRVADQRAIGRIEASDRGLLSVAFTGDGKRVLCAGLDGVLRMWDVKTHALAGTFAGHSATIYTVRVARDGTRAATASLDSTVRVWSLEQKRELRVLRGHTDGVVAVAMSPDGELLASAGEDKQILLWDLERGQTSGLPLRGHMGFIRALAFSPDGEDLASASQDQTIRLWHLPSRRRGRLERRLRHHSWVQAVAFAPGGKLLATGTRSGRVRLWDARSRRSLGLSLRIHATAIVDIAFSPDGRLLASAARDGTLAVVRMADHGVAGPPQHSPQGAGLHSLAFGRGGALFSGGGDGTILRWKVTADGQSSIDSAPLPAHQKAVLALDVSPDGRLLASASRDQLVRLWRAATLQPVGPVLRGHDEAVYDVAFSGDGKTLASASGDGTVRLWPTDADSGQVRVLEGHRHWVLSVALSPSGRWVASGGSDGTVRLWDRRAEGALESPLPVHEEWVYDLAFSPDGRTLASASGDKTVRLWAVAAERARSLAREIDALTNLHVTLDGRISSER